MSGILVLIIICIAGIVYCWEDEPSSGSSNSTYSNKKNSEKFSLYDERYEDGTYRFKNLSETGYYYSDGKESRVGMFNEEHRSNGEVVYDNAYISGRKDIYNKNGEYIGYEYKDSFGRVCRVDKK